MTIYEIKINRKFVESKIDRFIQGDWWWDVDVRVNNTYMGDLSDCGWAKSLKKAKQKALKHVIKVEKLVPSDSSDFGVIIETRGTAEEVMKVLQKDEAN